jgi:hypothetical protein
VFIEFSKSLCSFLEKCELPVPLGFKRIITMTSTDENWIEESLVRMLHQHGLPRLHTHVMSDPSFDKPSSMSIAIVNESIGVPIVAVIDDAEKWTVLGTKAVISKHHGELVTVPYQEISSVEPAGLGQQAKAEHTRLEIRDANGRLSLVWLPPGNELFAFCNILRRMAKLRAEKQQ